MADMFSSVRSEIVRLREENRDLRARLAAVEARLEMFKRAGSMDPITVNGLLAAARGQAQDRAAECEYCGGLDGAHRPTCRRAQREADRG